MHWRQPDSAKGSCNARATQQGWKDNLGARLRWTTPSFVAFEKLAITNKLRWPFWELCLNYLLLMFSCLSKQLASTFQPRIVSY